MRMFARITDLDVLTPTMKLFELHFVPKRNNAEIDAQFARLHHGLAAIEARMAQGPFALGDDISFADAVADADAVHLQQFPRHDGPPRPAQRLSQVRCL